jgi:hypothetical protein
LEHAIQGFTVGGAECLGFGWEKKLGSIEELYKTQVERTVVGGEVVYER